MEDFEFTGPRYVAPLTSNFTDNVSPEVNTSYLSTIVSLIGILTITYFAIEFFSSRNEKDRRRFY
tara:strand:+ start:92 stop:286 length:195 start_codon:yes stop_codon:yes gene_type:complete